MANTIDPRWAWEPYSPSPKSPWNLQKVGHLYRRASFGPTWNDLQSGLKSEPQELINKLIKPGQPSASYSQETEQFLNSASRKFNNEVQATGWWLYRMMHGGDPFREKITLFWHNHFATSNAKVKSIPHMVGQYDLMNRHALGRFDSFLQEMSKDPAMMIWLDTVQSKKGMPNENYARELMELFSLGIGNYTEKDIREAARAFTGWEIQNGKFFNNAAQFDDSSKTVLGKKGNFKGEDIVRICLEQPACAKFIVNKLYRYLIGETPPSPELVEPLTKQFATSYDIGKLVETMIRSNLFFSETAYRARIKSPVDYVLGMVRATESNIGSTNPTFNVTTHLKTLGQDLFHPPSVKGWDGGPTWLNGQTLLFRQNMALDAAQRPADYRQPATAYVLTNKHGALKGAELANFFFDLFLQGDVAPETRKRITDYAINAQKQKLPTYWAQEDADEQRAISLCHLVMTLPEYQLD